MNIKKLPVLAACFLSIFAHADDTEIYGASEIDLEKRVNSNVLFIMDTSGSMGGTVTVTNNPYDHTKTYSGSYHSHRFYFRNYHDPYDGIPAAQLESAYSYGCSDEVTIFQAEGKVLGNFSQWRNNRWRSLQAGRNSYVRCDTGNSYWLYSGNYMNWYTDPTNVTSSTRMEVTVDVVKKLTQSLSNINLGLMRFDQDSDGGIVDVPVSDIATSGPLIRDKLDDYYAQGGTPLEESMYEAALYYRGEDWRYGNNARPNSSVETSRTSSNSSKYKTPIDATCQKNHIILLTDGQPTNDTNANSLIKNRISGLSLPDGLSHSCSGNGDCMDELAYWLRNTDQNENVIQEQAITTYTIGGFDLADGVELLKRTASWGGGQYYEANDTSGLTDALESIFLDILSTDSTFTAPAVTVNAFNASEHRDDLFYALFRPDDGVKWSGNLKKYRLNSDGFVYDANNAPAISEATGFFNDSSKDFWNDTNHNDGPSVVLGGVANLIEPNDRNLFSNEPPESSADKDIMKPFDDVADTDSLGIPASDVDNLVNWIKGIDVDDVNGDGNSDDSRNSIGDPLHSEPLVITYGGTDENPDSTIFFGTNEGFLHAINTETGKEQFAFMPYELHATQNTFYQDVGAAGDRPYGLDGSISAWVKDVNKNNLILKDNKLEDGEHAYIYAGMRRGGNNYYALDVSDRSDPKMLFAIRGGSGDFEQLGQTWSQMVPAKVKYLGETRYVLFFTGGYDTNQDGNNTKEDDTIGNAIYMVDATTGERLWWAGRDDTSANLKMAEMKNSMPASPALVDINNDGYTDYLYTVDMGGRIFRIDLNSETTQLSKYATGVVIASISGNEKEDNRRFYNKPDVSLVKDTTIGDYINIAVGTGHRAHPILTTAVKNRFYMIRDRSPYEAIDPSEYTTKEQNEGLKDSLADNELVSGNLIYDATVVMTKGDEAFELPNGSPNQLADILRRGGGWYIDMPNEAEKVLASSITFEGSVIFSTFSPSSGDVDNEACGADTGTSRVYILDILNGDSVFQKTLSHSGIAPRPVIVIPPNNSNNTTGEAPEPVVQVGTETIKNCELKGTCCDSNPEQCKPDPVDCDTENCNAIPVFWRQSHESR